MPTDLSKRCSKCGEEKPLDQFSRHAIGKDGRRPDCKVCQAIRNLAWLTKNRQKHRADNHRYYAENRERVLAKNSQWKRDNPDANRLLMLRAQRKRMATVKGRLERAIRDEIRKTLKGGTSGKRGRRSFDLVGYSVADLQAHLEARFLPGMSWENYGQWHIDHIIPLSAFNYETPDDYDFRRAWALANLQPLWASENYRKKNRLAAPFQPGLLLG